MVREPETIRLFAKLAFNEVFIASTAAIKFEAGTLVCHVPVTNPVTKPVTRWTRVTNVRHQPVSAGGVCSGLFHPLHDADGDFVPAVLDKSVLK